MKFNFNKKTNNGITLIALVLTIIVLLILAGVSIAMLTGENGILSQANEAKALTKRAEIVEKISLEIQAIKTTDTKKSDGSGSDYKEISDLELFNILDKYGEVKYEDGKVTGIVSDEGSYKIAISEVTGGKTVEAIKDANEVYLKTTTINGGAKSSNNPTIPAGFKPVDTTGASWGDGTTAPATTAVNAGLVIEDGSGNQFVWVPVDGTTIEYKKHEYVTTSTNDTTTSTADTGNGNWKTYHYRKYSDWTDATAEINKSSVTEHGGFYVARYEAGVLNAANFYADKAGDVYYTSSTMPSKNVTAYKPVSKANNQSWNYISQENALTVASKMYEGSNSVKSQLIDGYAWDAIATWIGNDTSYPNIHGDSSNYGNYYSSSFSINNVLNASHTDNNGWTVATQYKYGSVTAPNGSGMGRVELATGSLDGAKVKNIYDFAGNMWEWTTETGNHGVGSSGTKYAVLRGGSFNDRGTGLPASCRYGYETTANGDFNFGFRVTLYL